MADSCIPMENYPIAITVNKEARYFEIGEYVHQDEDKCKFRVFENAVYVASFTPDHLEILQICQNPGSIDEKILHLLAERIEAHHPNGVNDNVRKVNK